MGRRNNWIKQAKKNGAKHIISVCDTFDWTDFAVFVMPHEDLETKKKEYDGQNMHKINEIITIEDGKVSTKSMLASNIEKVFQDLKTAFSFETKK